MLNVIAEFPWSNVSDSLYVLAVVESTASVADQLSKLESDVPPNTPKPEAEAEVELPEKTQEDKR